MRIAVLSDVHCNCFALEAVLDEVRSERADRTVFLGDLFGYYPWAVETYALWKPLDAVAIKGNHDILLTDRQDPQPAAWHWQVAQDNERKLRGCAPEAIEWIEGLPSMRRLTVDGLKLHLCHGTPDDPVEGRYYPDDETQYAWFPAAGETLLLGHTHYPLQKRCQQGGLILNPGSVGQPRDGDVRASWAMLDTSTCSVALRRTPYDQHQAIQQLHDIEWDRRAIAALQKNYRGPLRVDTGGATPDLRSR